MEYALWIARVSLATLFFVAAISKLSTRAGFRELVVSLPAFGVPSSLASPAFAIGLVAMELATASLMLAMPQVGGIVAAAMLAGFALGIARALTSREPVTCRCFGASSTPIGRSHLIRNLVLATIGIGVAIANPAATLARSLPLALATFAGLGLGAVLTRWDDLAFIFSTPNLPGRRAR
jgi:Methylamine utilisation protein MauE